MKYDVRKHHRQSIRLRGYDYARAGAYFVTVCARDRECLFGTVADGAMRLNEYGATVETWWQDIPRHFKRVGIDAYIIMPNHMHGIVVIEADDAIGDLNACEEIDGGEVRGAVTGGGDTGGGETPPLRDGSQYTVGAGSPRPQSPRPQSPDLTSPRPARRPTLGQIVAYFKYQSSKSIAAAREMPGVPVWQRNYYEHILRSQESLDKIRRYINENPARWAFDRENPETATPEPENPWRAEFLGNLDLDDLP